MPNRMHRNAVVLAASCTVAMLASVASAQTTSWITSAPTSLWNDPLNWSAGVPNAAVNANMSTFGTHVVDLGGATRFAASIANGGGIESTFRLTNGTLNTPLVGAGGQFIIDASLTTSSPQLTLSGWMQINGDITGSGFDVVIPTSSNTTVVLNGNKSYTGTTIVRSGLTINGSISNSTLVRIGNRAIVEALDPAASPSDVFGNSSHIELTGGSLRLYPNQEIVGAIDLPSNLSRLAVEGTMTVGQINRSRGATLWFNADNGGNTRVRAATLPEMTGDFNQPLSLPVVPWAFAAMLDAGATDAALTRYDRGANTGDPSDDVGFRPLRTAEFGAGLAPATNAKLVSATANIASPTSVNSLTLKGAGVQLQAGDLNVASGGIMFLPGSSRTVSIGGSGSLVATNGGEMIVHAFLDNSGPYNGAATNYSINVPISASSFTKSGNADLTLGAASTFGGGIRLNGGTLIAADVGALGSSGSIIFSGGSLKLQTPSMTVTNQIKLDFPGSLSNGVTMGLSNLPGTTTKFIGPISGEGNVILRGGTFRFTDAASGNVMFLIHDGAMLIDFDWSSDTWVGSTGTSASSLIGGSGAARGIFRPVGATFSPGPIDPAAARFTGGETGIYGGTSRFDLGGTTAGTSGYDQLRVLTSLELSDVTLAVNLLGGFTPSPGQSFRIIDNQFTGPMSGAFKNLPEGSSFVAGGAQFRTATSAATGTTSC